MRARNAIIYGRTIRLWAMQIKKRIDVHSQLNFKASERWATNLKKRYKIVSRKVTHKVSKSCFQESRALETRANEFVGNVRTFIEIHKINDKDMLNADQSRFERKFRSGRTLSIQGKKRIFGTTGFISVTTHSYMIMPVIAMSKTLLSHMYVLVSEISGKFPANLTIDLPNIIAYAPNQQTCPHKT